jgi:stage II sporulation protein D
LRTKNSSRESARRARGKLCLVLLLIANVIPAAAQTVRIGVFGLFKPRQFTVTAVEGSALIATAGQRTFALDPSAGAAVLSVSASGSQMLVTSSDTNARVSSLRAGARDGRAGEFTLAIPGKLHRRFSGVLQVTANEGVLTAVVEMDLELAVASAVQAESPPGAPLEALQAQAVATRSYFVAGSGGHAGFDFCDTTHCQFLRESPPADAPATIATLSTRGLVLAYHDRPFPAFYSASCGGHTRTLADAGLRVRDYPYYAVACEYCRAHPVRWTAQVSHDDAAALSRRAESERLRLARRLGWSTVRSNEYLISSHGGGAVISGVGVGHGIGLCQRGAAALARDGAGFRAILAHYYPNTSIVTIETVHPKLHE